MDNSVAMKMVGRIGIMEIGNVNNVKCRRKQEPPWVLREENGIKYF